MPGQGRIREEQRRDQRDREMQHSGRREGLQVSPTGSWDYEGPQGPGKGKNFGRYSPCAGGQVI